jgi:hypothetical protein
MHQIRTQDFEAPKLDFSDAVHPVSGSSYEQKKALGDDSLFQHPNYDDEATKIKAQMQQKLFSKLHQRKRSGTSDFDLDPADVFDGEWVVYLKNKNKTTKI